MPLFNVSVAYTITNRRRTSHRGRVDNFQFDVRTERDALIAAMDRLALESPARRSGEVNLWTFSDITINPA